LPEPASMNPGGSHLPGMADDGTGSSVMSPGIYFLAISGFPSVPVDVNGTSLFLFGTPSELSGPDGSMEAIAGWSGPGAIGDYEIALSGVIPVPSPAESSDEEHPPRLARASKALPSSVTVPRRTDLRVPSLHPTGLPRFGPRQSARGSVASEHPLEAIGRSSICWVKRLTWRGTRGLRCGFTDGSCG